MFFNQKFFYSNVLKNKVTVLFITFFLLKLNKKHLHKNKFCLMNLYFFNWRTKKSKYIKQSIK